MNHIWHKQLFTKSHITRSRLSESMFTFVSINSPVKTNTTSGFLARTRKLLNSIRRILRQRWAVYNKQTFSFHPPDRNADCEFDCVLDFEYTYWAASVPYLERGLVACMTQAKLSTFTFSETIISNSDVTKTKTYDFLCWFEKNIYTHLRTYTYYLQIEVST